MCSLLVSECASSLSGVVVPFDVGGWRWFVVPRERIFKKSVDHDRDRVRSRCRQNIGSPGRNFFDECHQGKNS